MNKASPRRLDYFSRIKLSCDEIYEVTRFCKGIVDGCEDAEEVEALQSEDIQQNLIPSDYNPEQRLLASFFLHEAADRVVGRF
jgi:hypothetical protein